MTNKINLQTLYKENLRFVNDSATESGLSLSHSYLVSQAWVKTFYDAKLNHDMTFTCNDCNITSVQKPIDTWHLLSKHVGHDCISRKVPTEVKTSKDSKASVNDRLERIENLLLKVLEKVL